MPDQTMIERVARALIRERIIKDGHAPSAAMEATIDEEWPAYVRYARAVLTNMRGPTLVLLDAMMAAESATRDNTAIWNAAIDAALEDAP